MKKIAILAPALLATLSMTHQVQASEQVAAANNCLACHQIAAPLVGPSYQDVAARYKGQADAAEILTKSIKEGVVNKWAAIPMPPNSATSDADVKILVDWIIAM